MTGKLQKPNSPIKTSAMILPDSRINDSDTSATKDLPVPEGGPPPYIYPKGPRPVQRAIAPKASVNQPHLREGSEPLKGTFYIDPKVPCLGFDARGFKSRKHDPPHASFRTRKGDISLKLTTVGDADDIAKAEVMVASRSGNIAITLLSTPVTTPRIDLEVASRRGDVALFLPLTFSGVIQLKSRKGHFHALPELAAVMRTIKRSDTEALLLVGDHGLTTSKNEYQAAINFCQLTSRSGNVVVGLSGLDDYEPRPIGFWKRLFGKRHYEVEGSPTDEPTEA